jgi:hypothetical protein
MASSFILKNALEPHRQEKRGGRAKRRAVAPAHPAGDRKPGRTTSLRRFVCASVEKSSGRSLRALRTGNGSRVPPVECREAAHSPG